MDQLIKILNYADGQAVSGRELHDFLGVREQYPQWFTRMVDYGFAENVDFISLPEKSVKPHGGRPQVDHALTLDMAKEIAMIQEMIRVNKHVSTLFKFRNLTSSKSVYPKPLMRRFTCYLKTATRLIDKLSRLILGLPSWKTTSQSHPVNTVTSVPGLSEQLIAILAFIISCLTRSNEQCFIKTLIVELTKLLALKPGPSYARKTLT